MQLRIYYLDHADEVRTVDVDVPDEGVDQELKELGHAMANGGLFIAKEAEAFSFAVPARRVLEIERLPQS